MGATLCRSPAEAVQNADLVISAITASSAQDVAKACSTLLRPGQYFLDLNSISPHAKRENDASRVIGCVLCRSPRVAEHGRVAEMREVVSTLNDVGVAPLMANATAQRQDALIDAMLGAGIDYDAASRFAWRDLAEQK